ncbi:TetR/AcrR family transcriptional regulator [Salinimonas marina]|uniref:TetR/AcrR family transcriptional regulator n=1 Tax=Salinimonas marina TaxID=2785918 RepID=A0A7S9HCN8_9ALTE|nr:TetR/AcrR family transcriptional regulator [Salinimonas marina]QPG04666.1 TetR/AcrR family transcriptional regulator [Salinimonas marina]
MSDSTTLLNTATDLFWRKGYQATSMRDIQHALDLRPGSLYSRFQSKSELFEKVIVHYAEQILARLEQSAQSDDGLTATRQMFIQELLKPEELRYQRQCLLLNAMAESSKLEDRAAQALEDAMAKMLQGFIALAMSLQQQQMVCGHTAPEKIGQWLQIQFIGLRNTAFVSNNDEEIIYFIDKLLIDLQHSWPDSA